MEVLLSFHLKDVGVEGLSRVALRSEDRQQELLRLIEAVGAEECFYLSTCNRTEFLFTFSSEPKVDFVSRFGVLPTIHSDRPSIIRHLLSVALSKDSVVFGESQILGQFKHAYQQGLSWKTIGGRLAPLLNTVVKEAKSIRTTVGLNTCHTSVSTVAGQQLLTRLGPTDTILFVGAGETNLILARYLIKRGLKNFVWTSRNLERAQKAVQELGGVTWLWSETQAGNLPSVHAVCVATHSTEILLHKTHIQAALPQVVCDLAVPANASAEACLDLGVEYLGMDQLNEELSHHQNVAIELIRLLEVEIEAALGRIMAETQIRASKSLITATIANTETVLQRELDGLMNGPLASLGEKDKEAFRLWSKKLIKKVVHLQIETVKSALQQQIENKQDETSSK